MKPTPRMVAVEPSSTGVSSRTVTRTRMNCGLCGSRLIDWIWPTGTPEKVTELPLASPSTDWVKKMS